MPADYEPDDRAASDGEGQVSEVSAMDPAGPDRIDPSHATVRHNPPEPTNKSSR